MFFHSVFSGAFSFVTQDTGPPYITPVNLAEANHMREQHMPVMRTVHISFDQHVTSVKFICW